MDALEIVQDFFVYSVKLFVHRLFGLTPDVFFHGFFVHVSNCRHIISVCPKASVLFVSRFWVLVEDHQCILSLEITYKI